MFATPEQIAPRLSAFNARWQARKQTFARWTGGGWWGRGSVISPDTRGWYNSFLPPDEYQHDLRLLARDFLRDDALVPTALHLQTPPFLSLPDLWATLADPYAGRVAFPYHDLLGLFCSLADPSRMGTAAGRYPQQLLWLRQFLAGRPPARLLDLGCGIGLGTWELAFTAAQTCGCRQTVGVTLEGLEVWMATTRRLPHDPRRQLDFDAFPRDLPVIFRQGRAEAYDDDSTYDVIVCNGLAGGRFLNQPAALHAFLCRCRQQLVADGALLLGNRFHDGTRPGVERLLALAVADGWHIAGDWQDLRLMHPGRTSV